MAGDRIEDIKDGALRDYVIKPTGTFLKTVTKLDEVSGASTVIDYSHHEIHEGDHYFVEDFETLGSGAAVEFGVIAGATKQAHMLFDLQATGQTEFTSYKVGSFDSDGTEVISVCSNTTCASNGETKVYRNPTVADYGTIMNSRAFGLALTPSKIEGGAVRGEAEIVLGTTGTFIYRIKSQSAGNIVSYHGNWYEHTPSF